MVPERFEAFGPTHYLLLGLFLVGAAGFVLLGRRQRGTDAATVTSRALAVAIPCVTIPRQVWVLLPGQLDLGTSFPLQLSDLAWMVTVWALWTHRPLPVALTYYWGLTLTLQAIVTPSLGQTFPDLRFLAFWCKHLLVVWSALYLTPGLRIAPTWRLFRLTVGITAAWAVAVYVVDLALDVNYGYVVHKPSAASLLDLLGPWPVYVVASLGVLAAVWALMTWPWVRGRRLA